MVAISLLTLSSNQDEPAAAVGPGIADIRVSGDSGCALTTAQEIYCWGSNTLAQGDGSWLYRPTPTRVNGRYISFEMGNNSVCAIAPDHKLWCWGVNPGGLLGSGDLSSSPDPRPVVTAESFTSVSLGETSTCALTADGVAWCWGDNSYGQLGTNDNITQHVPVVVSTTRRFSQISVGLHHACAVAKDAGYENSLWCWGRSQDGQLGNNSVTGSTVPVPVTNAPGAFESVTAGRQNTCGVLTSGVAYCWGANGSGQLGIGASGGLLQPTTAVSGGYLWKSLSLENAFNTVCGVTRTGVGFCWGNGRAGQLGDGGTNGVNTNPSLVSGGRTFLTITTGGDQSCGITTDGPYCWGRNVGSMLGNGTLTAHGNPVRAEGLPELSSVSAGENHACARTATGQVWCWGNSWDGKLGTPWDYFKPPTPIPGFTVDQLAVNGQHACGLVGNDIYCWGINPDGRLGDGSNVNKETPTKVVGNHAFASVHLGDRATCGITTTGEAYCWGNGEDGKLGNGTHYHSSVPVLVSGSHTWSTLAMGWSHTCGITSDGANAGKVYCWGNGENGKLGTGTSASSATPVETATSKRFTQVDVGRNHACALSTDNQTHCWGWNDTGTLGDGTNTTRTSPVLILSGVAQITVGHHTTCARMPDGTVRCWGSAYHGQAGSPITTSRWTPTTVATPLRFSSIASGWNSMFGLTADGTLYGWGSNKERQLAVDAAYHTTPQRVLLFAADSNLNLTAIVLPYLLFSTSGVPSGTCNGATITAPSTPSHLGFGEPSPVANVIAAQRLTVSTNAAEGYSLTLLADSPLTSHAHAITMHPGTSSSPSAFAAPGTEQVGYSTDRLAAFLPNKWAGLPLSTPAILHTANGVVEDDQTNACFQLGASGATPAGNYQTLLKYAVLPKY